MYFLKCPECFPCAPHSGGHTWTGHGLPRAPDLRFWNCIFVNTKVLHFSYLQICNFKIADLELGEGRGRFRCDRPSGARTKNTPDTSKNTIPEIYYFIIYYKIYISGSDFIIQTYSRNMVLEMAEQLCRGRLVLVVCWGDLQETSSRFPRVVFEKIVIFTYCCNFHISVSESAHQLNKIVFSQSISITLNSLKFWASLKAANATSAPFLLEPLHSEFKVWRHLS